jgi:hypothetical protein
MLASLGRRLCRVSTFKVPLATESHPKQHDTLGPYHWTFSPACLDRMAEQAVGLPVTVNFEGEPVGGVVGAERTADGLMLTIDAEADMAARVASPQFIATDDRWSDDYSDRVIFAADLKEIGMTDD